MFSSRNTFTVVKKWKKKCSSIVSESQVLVWFCWGVSKQRKTRHFKPPALSPVKSPKIQMSPVTQRRRKSFQQSTWEKLLKMSEPLSWETPCREILRDCWQPAFGIGNGFVGITPHPAGRIWGDIPLRFVSDSWRLLKLYSSFYNSWRSHILSPTIPNH